MSRSLELVLDRHDEVLRREFERFRGSGVTKTGNGFFAVFDGPGRAVERGLAVIEAVQALALELRVGVHTGECEPSGQGLGGITIEIGAQIAALAEPGQVLVSRTVTDLVAVSSLDFIDRGKHELQGLPDKWRLFSAEHGTRVRS